MNDANPAHQLEQDNKNNKTPPTIHYMYYGKCLLFSKGCQMQYDIQQMHAHLKILTVCLKIIVKDLSIIILFVQNKISIITLFSTKWTVDMSAPNTWLSCLLGNI